MGATIMDGVEIPDDSFVAAGALVTPFKTFESGMLIKGVPAKSRQRTQRRRERRDHLQS